MDSTLRQTITPKSTPAKVPTMPIAAPVMKNIRMMAPDDAPIVRRMAMSAPLSLTSMIRAGHDIERRHQHDQRQDHEHDVALDLERGEEGLVAVAPIADQHLSPGRILDRLAQVIDQVRIGDEQFDRLGDAFGIEIKLGFSEA